MVLKTYRIKTVMGECSGDLPFLTEQEKVEFNLIGYTGKNTKGQKTSRLEFLNKLKKGKFAIEQLKSDKGDFVEEFLIVHVSKK